MIENIKISKLKLLKNNPRKITHDQMAKLVKSLQEDPDFLQKRPVLVNRVEDELIVYAGNQRVRAAKKCGWKEVPCIIDDNIDDQVMRSRVIKDNASFGEFDFDLLANEWDVGELLEWGFTESMIQIPKDLVGLEKPQEECDQCPTCGKKMKSKS